MNAIEVYEKALRRLEKNETTISEFEEEIAVLKDVEQVRHGRWEYYNNGTDSPYALCSMCDSGLAKEDAMHFGYCPYCGAKMDLEG